MERAGDCHDLLELETLREGLLNFSPHVSFAHQIFGGAARGKIFQLAQFRAVTAGGFEVSVIAARLLEVPFPAGFVVGFTGKLGHTVVNRNPFWAFLHNWHFAFLCFTPDKLGPSWFFLFRWLCRLIFFQNRRQSQRKRKNQLWPSLS